MAEMRVHRALAQAGVASRRAAEKLVAEGRVTVNGNVAMVGQVVRDLVDACEAGHDHDADPVTTWCDRIDRPLDLGALSRLRSGSATTGTVLG